MSHTVAPTSAVQSILDLQEALEALPSNSRLSSADADAIYGLAYQLVAQNRFETAYRYFSLLTLYKPTHVPYLQGLALTYRMMERYDEALNVYSFLATIDSDNLDHQMAIVECLLLQRDFEEAQQTVAWLLQHCKDNAITGKVSDRAQALVDLLSSEGAVSA
jgi:tetratricopeptide (TPR) repeat protein